MMIEVTHHEHTGSTEFYSRLGEVQGGGRTLADSHEAAEHAVRVYLSRVQGHAVEHDVALHQTLHVDELEREDAHLSPRLHRSS